jgi:hypothetical protein
MMNNEFISCEDFVAALRVAGVNASAMPSWSELAAVFVQVDIDVNGFVTPSGLGEYFRRGWTSVMRGS